MSFQSIPKIELHQHLQGSIRKSTFIELYEKKYGKESMNTILNLLNGERSLHDCFRLFDIIHDLVDSEAILERIVVEVVEDLIHQHVIYAELRTTPREYTHGVPLSEKESIDRILKLLKELNKKYENQIRVRLLVSINRSESKEKALRTAQMAVSYYQDKVEEFVGVDLSGNPTAAPFAYFSEAFELLKNSGVPVVLHAGEVPDNKLMTSKCCCNHTIIPIVHDIDDIINYHPTRIGHALYFNEDQIAKCKKESIPIEVCPTSNMKTLSLTTIEEHPILPLVKNNMLFSVNTDDPFIFDISATDELECVAKLFNWDKNDIIAFTRNELKQIIDKDTKTIDFLNSHINHFITTK